MEPFNVPTIKVECAKNVLGGHFPTKYNDVTDYHFFIVEIIVESVNWRRCQNITENYYYHDGEQLGFDKKAHIKTQNKKKKKKNVLVIFMLQETKNSNLFDKNCTQENVKCHIQ